MIGTLKDNSSSFNLAFASSKSHFIVKHSLDMKQPNGVQVVAGLQLQVFVAFLKSFLILIANGLAI